MSNYYNEHDPLAAAWLRELMKAGLIPAGVVDERSIEDVCPNELLGFTQCHFFAGIGGWSRALQLAGIPSTVPLWTGSCPCQPFSSAGKGTGFADERHLWPALHHLVKVCRPPVVLGEQVASSDGLRWWDLVQNDLEMEGYACGKADLCAAGVGAPHIRQRLWWVGRLGFPHCTGWEPGRVGSEAVGHGDSIESAGGLLGLAHTFNPAEHGNSGAIPRTEEQNPEGSAGHGLECSGKAGWTSPLHGFWRDADWLFCRDGKWRPVEPGTFPLAHGVSNRMGRLRGYGNAIVPQVAAEFIKAALLP